MRERGIKLCLYPQITQNLRNLWMALRGSEIQLQPKLELPRVEGRGWAAEVAAIARALIEQPDVVDKRRRGGFVKAIEEIEPFRNQLQPYALAQRYQLRDAHIQRDVTMRQTEIAREASTRKHATCN
jgi:hypothetical protein